LCAHQRFKKKKSPGWALHWHCEGRRSDPCTAQWTFEI